MKRFTTDWTNKKASMRLTAMLVAVVFAVGTLFVPTGILAAETDEDEITANETVEAVTPAGENEFDEVEASKTEGAEADEAEAGEAQPEEDVAETQQPAAEASEPGTGLEELVVAHDGNGDAAAVAADRLFQKGAVIHRRRA